MSKVSESRRGKHLEIERVRGRAKDEACVDAESLPHSAQAWAHIHGTDGEDINNYQPMCTKHHNAYDWTDSRAAQASERMKGNTLRRGSTHSPEAIEKIREAKIGNTARKGMKLSDETKLKISQSAIKRYADKREGK